jgi:hypothetical protein
VPIIEVAAMQNNKTMVNVTEVKKFHILLKGSEEITCLVIYFPFFSQK